MDLKRVHNQKIIVHSKLKCTHKYTFNLAMVTEPEGRQIRISIIQFKSEHFALNERTKKTSF